MGATARRRLNSASAVRLPPQRWRDPLVAARSCSVRGARASDGVEVEVNPTPSEIRPGLLGGHRERDGDPW